MHKAFEVAAQRAARLAALESFRQYGHAIHAHIAWVSITAILLRDDLFLYEQLPAAMPQAFYTEYAKVCAELSAEAA